MLFDVTAVLSSVALGPVAEAFSAREIMAASTVVSSSENIPAPLEVAPVVSLAWDAPTVSPADIPTIPVPDAPPGPFLNTEPFADTDPAQSPNELVQGTRLLQQLALLPVADLTDWVGANQASIDELVAHPPLASDVSMWWSSMDWQSRAALRTATPQLVGNLDGVPYTVRDLANRTLLAASMSDLEATIVGNTGRTVIENAEYQLSMLQSIDDALSADDGGRRTLMSLDVNGQGKAAIVIGDLRTADYVSYMVPGMFFTIQGQMVYWSEAAERLQQEQLDWLARFGDTTSTVATVAWIGYHTPNLTNVGSMDNAVAAEASLASTIEGLQALRPGHVPFISVVAHSYGSTAALMALTDYNLDIDALAVVGSPGSAAQSVSELSVKNSNVYVGEAEWDPVPNSAFYGSDPGSPDYGATTFGTNGGTDPITGATMLRSFFHIEYFSPNTESLRNIALIGIGHGDEVTAG